MKTAFFVAGAGNPDLAFLASLSCTLRS